MEAHFNIEQGSYEWHEIRHGKIGGTASKGLFVKSDTLLFDLLAEKTESFIEEENYISDDMLRGMQLEPEAREWANKNFKCEFIECGWMQSDIELLGISPDGITADFKQAIEIKCPQAKRHIQTVIENKIPLDNLHQCLHYFTVNDRLEQLHFISYRPESIKPIFVKTLTRMTKINLGTKAKPDFRVIEEWVEVAKNNATELQNQIKQTLSTLW
jgi:putative phage-type endonuclease